MATLPGAWRCRVSARTGWPSVSILWLGEMESLVCNFYPSVAARKIVWADLSLTYTRMLLGRWATNQQTVLFALFHVLDHNDVNLHCHQFKPSNFTQKQNVLSVLIQSQVLMTSSCLFGGECCLACIVNSSEYLVDHCLLPDTIVTEVFFFLIDKGSRIQVHIKGFCYWTLFVLQMCWLLNIIWQKHVCLILYKSGL